MPGYRVADAESTDAAAAAARKMVLGGDDELEGDEDEFEDEDEEAGEGREGGADDALPPTDADQAAADEQVGGELLEGQEEDVGPPPVDREMIAAADAAGAALPVEEQHAGSNDERPLANADDEREAAPAAKKVPGRAGNAKKKLPARPPGQRVKRADVAVAKDADAPPVTDPVVTDDRAAVSGDNDGSWGKRPSRGLDNTHFTPARVIVNPRCVTTYAGVSHTQLALDLFGSGDDKEPAPHEGGKYALDEWNTAPETFVRIAFATAPIGVCKLMLIFLAFDLRSAKRCVPLAAGSRQNSNVELASLFIERYCKGGNPRDAAIHPPYEDGPASADGCARERANCQ